MRENLEPEFETEKEAEAYAEGLLQEAKKKIKSRILLSKAEKSILDEAKAAGNRAIAAVKRKKELAKLEDEAVDKDIAKHVEEAKARAADELVPRLYQAINFALKVADRGVGYALQSPIQAAKFANLMLDINKRLEIELQVKSLKAEYNNAIVQSDFVKILLRDPGLWQIIGLKSTKIPRILAKFREAIGKEVADIIDNPGTLSTKSKFVIVKELLNNPHAVEALVQVAQSNRNDFAKLLMNNGSVKAILAQYHLNEGDVGELLPSLIAMTEIIPKNREFFLQVFGIVEPVILGEKLNVEALGKLLEGDGFKKCYGEITRFIEKNKEVLGKLLSDIPDIKKFKIDGNIIVGLLANEKTVNTLIKAYTSRTMKNFGHALVAALSSKEMRSIAFSARSLVARAVASKITSAVYSIIKKLTSWRGSVRGGQQER